MRNGFYVEMQNIMTFREISSSYSFVMKLIEYLNVVKAITND